MKIILLSLLLLTSFVNAQNTVSTKTSCIQQSAYPDNTLNEQKKILIEKAKQESLEELYGALIFSSTDIVNGKLQSDEIKSRAVGAVRVKGNPSFYNGKNLGEICADVTSYVTPADIIKFSPKQVSLQNFCFNDTSVSMRDIKTEARLSAYKEMLIQYKPSLKNISKVEAEKLLHGFKESNTKFDFDTASYCFNAVGTILPYELEMNDSENILSTQVDKENSKLDNTLYGKWYGSYYWDSSENFLMTTIEIKPDNTFKATCNKGDRIKNSYYTGTVMISNRKVVLIPDQSKAVNAPSNYNTDALKLTFDDDDLTLTGKIMNYESQNAAKLYKVKKFPLEYTIENNNDDANGKWFGWYQWGNDRYAYLTMEIKDNNAEIQFFRYYDYKTRKVSHTVYKTKRKLLINANKDRVYALKYGEDGKWGTDNFKLMIDGNTIEGTLSSGSYAFYATKVSQFPPEL